MAGIVKPNVEELKKEGRIEFDDSIYKDYPATDGTKSLLDGDVSSKSGYGVLQSDNPKSKIIFTIFQKSNIWAYGYRYCDGGGSTPQSVDLYKKNDNDWILIKENIQTESKGWYLLLKEIDKGTYKLETKHCYVGYTEWYVEELETTLFLLQDTENSLYTIKHNKISKLNNNILNKKNFVTNGFDDYNLITKDILLTTFDLLNNIKIKIYNDNIEKKNINIKYKIKPFKPIDKFKEINNGKFDIIMKEIG